MMPVVGYFLLALDCQSRAHGIIYFQIGTVADRAADQVIDERRVKQGSLVVVLQQGQREIRELLKVGQVVITGSVGNIVKGRGGVWPYRSEERRVGKGCGL